MAPRILLISLTASLLSTGCTKGFTASGADTRGQMDFHARGMIVPDFNSGAESVHPVNCRQASSAKTFIKAINADS